MKYLSNTRGEEDENNGSAVPSSSARVLAKDFGDALLLSIKRPNLDHVKLGR